MAISSHRDRIAAATRRLFWLRRVSYVPPDGNIAESDRDRLVGGLGVSFGSDYVGSVYIVLDAERSSVVTTSTSPAAVVGATRKAAVIDL